MKVVSVSRVETVVVWQLRVILSMLQNITEENIPGVFKLGGTSDFGTIASDRSTLSCFSYNIFVILMYSVSAFPRFLQQRQYALEESEIFQAL